MTDFTPKSVFRLSIAILGLCSSYFGVLDLIASALVSLNLSEGIPGVLGSERYWAVRGLLELVLGLILIAGWFPFENLAYPDSGAEEAGPQS